jgi:hypothetical protein
MNIKIDLSFQPTTRFVCNTAPRVVFQYWYYGRFCIELKPERKPEQKPAQKPEQKAEHFLKGDNLFLRKKISDTYDDRFIFRSIHARL